MDEVRIPRRAALAAGLSATSLRPVTLVVTELAVIEPTPEGLVLRERAPGVPVDAVHAATAALLVPPEVPEMDP